MVLEWDPIDLATATLRSLTLYRNNAKAGSIPNPATHTQTKISGLAVDTEYSFYLILRTSAGTYSSEKLTVRTHKMTDLSGITVCPGVMPSEARENLETTLARIGAKPLQDFVRIDTTHFVCTEGRGQGWERATEMNIPVVRPEWVDACENQGRIVGVRAYYLNADPRLRPAPRDRPRPPQAQQQDQSPAVPPKDHTPTPDREPSRQQAVSPESERKVLAVGQPPEPPAQAGNNEQREISPMSGGKEENGEKAEPSSEGEDVGKAPDASQSPAPAKTIASADDGEGDLGSATADSPAPKQKTEEGFETVPI